MTGGAGLVQFSLSADGALVYAAGEAAGSSGVVTVVWVDRDGREEPLTAEPRPYINPRLSPVVLQLWPTAAGNLKRS